MAFTETPPSTAESSPLRSCGWRHSISSSTSSPLPISISRKSSPFPEAASSTAASTGETAAPRF
uniref:Uncharacterized protein n=1 Tax=Brassica campestris TaxID=3711 RepID=A0A3P5Z0M4_BRACM|nr:unnamed protein product [Brassica rapa]